MKKLVLVMHVSLDGFVAGVNGEMDWIRVDEELFAFGKQWTDNADSALYGRNTFQMMDAYWPTAAQKPNASQHDIDHSTWYGSVKKYVVSASLPDNSITTATLVGSNVYETIQQIKSGDGKDIVIYGSPTLVHGLNNKNLIDDYVLFVNPVALGSGIPLFKNLEARKKLNLYSSHSFSSGVICLHYQTVAHSLG